MGGLTDKAKGQVKEGVGVVLEDDELQSEGKLDQAKGHLEEAAENVKERVARAAGRGKKRGAGLKKAIAEKARRAAAQLDDKSRTKH